MRRRDFSPGQLGVVEPVTSRLGLSLLVCSMELYPSLSQRWLRSTAEATQAGRLLGRVLMGAVPANKKVCSISDGPTLCWGLGYSLCLPGA